MAIITSKRSEADEEAERNARIEAEEYAFRHDTASASITARQTPIWNQPPPTYEESAAGQSSSSRVSEIQNSNQLSSPQQNTDEIRRSERSIQDDLETNSSPQNEFTPLLGNRRQYRKQKYARGCKNLLIFCLIGIVLIMFYKMIKNNNLIKQRNPPNSWPNDGNPIKEGICSPILQTSKETWNSPNIPEYSCSTNFSLSANSTLNFIRAHGSSYFGAAHAVPLTVYPKYKWKSIHGGEGIDRIAVIIEARFTSQSLLNSIRFDKMINDKNSNKTFEGVSINSNNESPSEGQFIFLDISIILPPPSLRSISNLAKDGSSFISNFEFSADNLRFSFEDSISHTPEKDQAGISFGNVDVFSRTGGISLAMLIKANQSATFHVGSGPIRDIFVREKQSFNVIAPKIEFSTGSGPIWLTGAIGIESVSLRTNAGGMNVSNIVVAKKVFARTGEGMVGGRYSAHESLNLQSGDGETMVDVIADSNFYPKLLEDSGLLDILEPKKSIMIREEILMDSKWRTMSVHALTKDGSCSVNYHDQDENTRLLSTITSLDGMVKVFHSSGFEGQFETLVKDGSIQIIGPGSSENTNSKKNFIIDSKRTNGGEKSFLKGRLWSKQHKWEEGGSNRNSTFPISKSKVTSKDGSILARFC